MKVMHIISLGLAGAVAAPLAAQSITGAGATFPAPAYIKWGETYKRVSGVGLNYQGVGSGAGYVQISNRTVDFGASDAPRTPQELAKANLLQFPTVVGAVVVTANLPGVDETRMRISGPVLADIYLGKIRSWADPRIKALNPGINLPSLPISPVRRADGSGTTYVFTSYLSSVSPEWKSTVGAATSVEWKAGIGAKGNDGVAGVIKNAKGAIGYVEYVYAAGNHLGAMMMQNRDGRVIAPSPASFAAAASQADWPHAPGMAPSMINMPSANAWPITSATYILLPRNPSNAAASLNVMKFFDWTYKSGAPIASQLFYVTLPRYVQNAVRRAWAANIRGPNGQPVYRAR